MINEITSKTDWNAFLEEVDAYDFYHTYDYHQISCGLGTEKPILIAYTNNKTIIGLPLLLRRIPGTEFYDFTSIYGYGGPVYGNLSEDFDNTHYYRSLLSYFESKNIISVFSRLHPYLEKQENILSKVGEICTLGRVVNIDIILPLEESRRVYQKSLKNQVNKLRRTCRVRKAVTKKDILEFVEIYYENMNRLDANDNYFFKPEYFVNFINQTDFKTEILLVEELVSQKIIAGSMFVKTKQFVQFHLSGTRTEFLKLKPSKLFLDEMRIESTMEKFKYFNLGGGLGSMDDSLFDFKSAFSKDFKDFKIWKLIVNKNVYNELSKNIIGPNSNFFPLYRTN